MRGVYGLDYTPLELNSLAEMNRIYDQTCID